MTSNQSSESKSISESGFARTARSLVDVAYHGSRVAARTLLRRTAPAPVRVRSLAKPYLRFGGRLLTQPIVIADAQYRAMQNLRDLSLGSLRRMFTKEPLRIIEPEAGDQRFRHESWATNPVFNVIEQNYLIWRRWLLDTVDEVSDLSEADRRHVRFFTEQMVDALAPSNFLLTNPTVIRETINDRGANLLVGLSHLLRDLDQGRGYPLFRMTDPDAFRIGESIADTPGEVIYQNDLMQLIQYRPTTAKVFSRPLLVVPAWINKFYVMDLGEKKSMVRYWLCQGHTVFMISWVNPREEHAYKGFEDYMLEGPVAALDAIERATGQREVNAAGYCIGGTLLAATLGWLAARDDDRIKSASFFASLLEFSEVGDLKVFINEDIIRDLDAAMKKQGYLDGRSMAIAFNMLRPNSLMWPFFINNYLLGREPMPFDLLHWNCDSTAMPAAMHSFYLREMYLNNRLCEPGGITLAATPIDLGKVKIPIYYVAAMDDHIAPWTSCYRGTRFLGGKVRFVLAGSGHIAGIVNPPEKQKYGYRVSENTGLPPDFWVKENDHRPGSWWPDWAEWIRSLSGNEVDARIPGEGELPVIEAAPGSYVVNRPAPSIPQGEAAGGRSGSRSGKKTTPASNRKAKQATNSSAKNV